MQRYFDIEPVLRQATRVAFAADDTRLLLLLALPPRGEVARLIDETARTNEVPGETG